jgi:hypothetical protein
MRDTAIQHQRHYMADNGDIVLRSAADHRIVFFESQTIDPLMSGI